MKKLKCLFAMHELWRYFLQYMNYENKKIFFCNTWIMKIRKCLFAIHELWTSLFAINELWKKWKCLFAIHELWNYFVCNTWIMKIFV